MTPWFWFAEANYQFSYAGENLAVFFGDSEDVVDAWLNSPSHRANLLNQQFTEIGIAVAEGTYQGQETTFIVQLFGTPAVAQPVATLTTDTTPTETEGGEVGGETSTVITEEDLEPIAEETPSVPAEMTPEVIQERELEEMIEQDVVHIEESLVVVSAESVQPIPSTQVFEVQSNCR